MFTEKTFLQRIMDNELVTFVNQQSVTYENVPDLLDNKGSFLMEINSTSKAFQDTISKDQLTKVQHFYGENTNTYRNQLGERIIKIERPMSFNEAIQTIYDTKQLIGDIFAGALLIGTNSCIINPLHPLIALELLHNPCTVNKLLIFTYKDLDAINEKYNPNNIDPSDFDPEINRLMQMYQSRIKTRATKIIKNEVDYNNKLLNQKYTVSKFPGEDEDKEYYLVAHQLLTKGTFVPYYGTSLISKGSGISGFHMTPFKSCNLNQHNSTQPTSVCTGNTPNNTHKGLRTLHHANLSSPYDSNCMTIYSKPYADACIKKCFEVYKAAKIITEGDTDDQTSTDNELSDTTSVETCSTENNRTVCSA